MKQINYKKIIFLSLALSLGWGLESWAQPSGDSDFTGFERKPLPAGASPSSTPNKVEFPKLGDYVELDDSLKNEMYGTIDFPNAELKDIIKAISKLANKNFILDRKIENRKVTIISPQAVTKQEAYNAFLSALYMNDLTIVSMGKFLKIIEAKSALQSNIRVFTGDNVPASEEIITLLYKLNYLNVEEIQRYLNDIIARSGRVSFYPNTNTLVMTDTGLNLKKVVSILKQIDVPGHEDQLENIPIRYASAKGIATLVGEILEAQSGSRRNTGGGAARNTPQKTRGGGIITKIVPDERTNSLVVLANGRGVVELKSLVAKLDTPDAVGGGNIHIYYCKNAVAEDLSKTITSLISGVSKPDSKTPTNRASETNPMAPPMMAPQNRGGEESIKFEGNIKLTFDKPTNALVVVASGSDFAALKTILRKLDIPRRQVYVEATIMEVKTSNDREFGIGVNLAQSGQAQAGGFIPNAGFPSASTLASSFTTPATLAGVVAGFSAGRKVTYTNALGGTSTISTVTGLIRALASANMGNILHQPQVLTSDNEEAVIEVKNKVPYKKGAVTSTTGQITDSFDREDVIIGLKITPQIGKDNDLIRLKVEQQIDDFVLQDVGTEKQVNSTSRKANTMVVVRNGDTVVVGGLQKNVSSDSTSKFPLLGDLPIIGWLFKGKTNNDQKSNLILFLTPHVINEYSDLLKITERKIIEREKSGKGNSDYTDNMVKEVSVFKEKIQKDLKKDPPSGWAFKSDAEPKVDAREIEEPLPQSEPTNSQEIETSQDTSAYIQPSIPENKTSTSFKSDLASPVDTKLRQNDPSREESFNSGPFENSLDKETIKAR
jgi:general secretion pathway protein D